MVPYYSKSRDKLYPTYYRTDKRRKHGGLKARPVDTDNARWIPTSMPTNDLDRAVVESFAEMAELDKRDVLMVRAGNAAQSVRSEMEERKTNLLKQVEDLNRRNRKLDRAIVDGAGITNGRILRRWEEELDKLDLERDELQGRLQACEDILCRLELTELET